MNDLAQKADAQLSRLFLCITLPLAIITFLRAVRAPNLWSATQSTWSYQFGFIRRGLMGTLLSLSENISYTHFFYLASTLLALGLITLLFHSARLAKKLPANIFILSLFFFSPSLIYYVHTIGYMDHIGLLAALALAFMPAHTLSLAALCVITLLFHEINLVIILPLLITRALLAWQQNRALTPFTLAAYASLCPFFLLIFLHPTPENLQSMIAHITAHADFPLRTDNFAVLERNLHHNWTMNTGGDSRRPILGALRSYGIIYLPLTLFYATLILTILQKSRPRPPRQQALIIATVLLSSLLPLCAILVARDHSRFFALCGTVTYLCFLSVLHHTPAPTITQSRLANPINTTLFALLILTNITLPPNHLMDAARLTPLPFTKHIHYLSTVLQGRAPFPATPQTR